MANLSHRLPSGKLNGRQLKMLNMMMHGFNGNLTTGKWAKLAQCSTDTALRDVSELVALGVLLKAGESKRAAHYVLSEF